VPTTGVESTQELNYASFERQEMVNNYEQVHSYSSIKRLKERFSEGAKAFTSNSFDAAKDYQDFDDLADDLAENTVADSAGVDQEIKQTTKMLGGTELGSFYHRIMEDLLEKWCLNEFDYKEWVMLEAKNFGLNLHQQGQFFSWVDRMMKVPLVNGFSLSALKKDQLIIEKPFFLSVKPYQVDALYKLIRSKEGFEMPPLHSDQSQLNSVYQDSDLLQGVLTDETPSFDSIPAGFLKGFIDLSFEYEDTYYILDYKTNFLQGNNAYSSDSLNNQMIKLSYDIQGHLYSLAMHKFLATCKHDYSYQEHFGGYFYVFVRGLSTDNKMSGVHFYRPSEQRMKTMEVIVNGKQ
jgi:exodeoxyribonuclease V beta subunit